MILWIVGKTLNKAGTKWEFCGVFDDEEKAKSACKDDNYFVGPATLNQEIITVETIDWPDAYYPTAKEKA